MLCVRERDRRSSVGEQSDGSYEMTVQLIKAVLTEVEFSQAYVHNGRLTLGSLVKGKGIGIREIPEKEPPRTTTTCLFAGARGDVDGLCPLKCNVAGGSLEWRSIGDGRIKSIAGNTFTDILLCGSMAEDTAVETSRMRITLFVNDCGVGNGVGRGGLSLLSRIIVCVCV